LLDTLLELPKPGLGIEAKILDLPAMIRCPVSARFREEVGDGRGGNPIDRLPGGVDAQLDVRGSGHVSVNNL
jgi:hypothetical protein